ncbi:LOW QUALITY PROTEIN: Multidrug resistance protein ABC Superfamily [Phytophthora palmivora]|uniref:Multidrug resistance protein ABC Superfamily n=1 Tax=Phytophthora palmivora TaxID=4796 RepID=A0A2P4Y2J3_9STRA|nr:LOW QUALITY PROTEIN: Multidrug resistance protein ABC Superfamily [Phytophthora palmivora]
MKPMEYTSDGVPKNWDGKDWTTYKWAKLTVFEENDLKGIAVGTITKAMLQAATAEMQKEFKHKQIKIKRMIGDKATGSEMWTELCDLFEGKVKPQELIRFVAWYTELWQMKLMPGEDANLHLCKMFKVRTELMNLNYNIENMDMIEMLLENLPCQARFESLTSSIRYGADLSAFTSNKVRELIRAAAARQIEFRIKRGGKRDRGEHKRKEGKGDQGKFGHPAKSKEKSRACYVCGSEDHINVNCPEKAKKQNDAENSDLKRKPRSSCTIRRDHDDVQPELSDEDPGVATGMMTHGLTGVEVNEQPVNGLIAEVPEGAEVAGITGFGAIRDQVPEGRVDDGAVDGSTTERIVAQDHETAATNTSCWWYFDTASNSHVIGNRSYFVSFTEDPTDMQSRLVIADVETVAIVTEVDGVKTVVHIGDVFYVLGAEFGLFSPGLARNQGFYFELDHATMNFSEEQLSQLPHKNQLGDFQVTHPSLGGNLDLGIEGRALCNYTVTEGVATLSLWHERLCHTCPQYIKTTVDKGLKKKSHRKNINRATTKPNQVMYADILIPSKGNGTRYEAELLIMDGYSRFVRDSLTSKSSPVQELIDEGGELINRGVENWYARKGIEHLEALRNAVYVKNRVYNKVHVPVTPGRRKLHRNAKIGFVLGYAEDVVSCKVYFLSEHTAKFVTDLRVADDIVYRDRHNVDLDEEDLASLHFTPIVRNDEILQSSTTSVATDDRLSVCCEEGEAAGYEIMDTVCADTEHAQYEPIGSQLGTGDCNHDAVDTGIRATSVGVDLSEDSRNDERSRTHHEHLDFIMQESTDDNNTADDYENNKIKAGMDFGDCECLWKRGNCIRSCNTRIIGKEDLSDADEQDLGDDDDGDITVASVFESNDGSSAHLSNSLGLEEDSDKKLEGQSVIATNIQHENDREVINANAVLAANHPRQSGKRTRRDETPSEEERVETNSAKQTKRTRTGLRECNERR